MALVVETEPLFFMFTVIILFTVLHNIYFSEKSLGWIEWRMLVRFNVFLLRGFFEFRHGKEGLIIEVFVEKILCR